jgi:hypothetical protein
MIMVIHSEGQFDPGVSDVEQAGHMLQTMEGILAGRRGLPISEVRPSIARSLRTTIGTLVNIGKQRRKTIEHKLMVAIRRELIIVLQSEIVRLEHAIHIHRQTAGSHRTDVLDAAETQILEAKKTLRLASQ